MSEKHGENFNPEPKKTEDDPSTRVESESLDIARPDSMEEKLDLSESKDPRKVARENYRRLFLEFLENTGIVEYSKQDQIIVDTEGLKNFSIEKIKDERPRRRFASKGEKNPIHWQDELLDLFAGQLVLSKTDYEKLQNGDSATHAKPLFYTPQKEDAFDVSKIKESDFHISTSALNGFNKTFNAYFEKRYGYSAEEAELALRVYHPKFGNGERDENGKLMVADPLGSKAKRPLTGKWITRKSGIKGVVSKNDGTNWNRPKDTFQKPQFKNLKESGLVRGSDFTILETSKSADILRRESRIGKRGKVFIAGSNYTLGSEFEGRLLVKLEDEVYGIVEETKGQKRISHTLRTLTRNGINRKKKEFEIKNGKPPSRGSLNVRVDEIDISPFHSEELAKPRHGEEAASFADRVPLSAKNYNMLERLSTDMASEAGIGLHTLSLREQHWLSSYAFSIEDRYDKLIEFAKEYGADGLKTFLACEFGENYGDQILDLSKKLDKKTAKKVFEAYGKIVHGVALRSTNLYNEISESTPNTPLTPDDIEQAFLARGKDLLTELNAGIKKNGIMNGKKAVKFLTELREETKNESVVRSQFKNIAELLSGGQEIDLENIERSQASVVENLEKSDGHALLLRTLHRMGRLKPTPEIHWRVDRKTEEYSSRLGLDIQQFLEKIAPKHKKGILLEFGPGSGAGKKERSENKLSERYTDYAMADAVYYSPQQVVEKVIDFEKIEARLGSTLTEADKKMLSEIIYKTLYIQEDTGGKDDVSYDKNFLQRLQSDPNSIKNALSKIKPKLEKADTLPQTKSVQGKDGNTRYPFKLKLSEQSENVQRAKEILQKNPSEFVKNDQDVFETIDAYPAGTMVGDFSEIKKLQPNQIDVALGVRSTVFLPREQYGEFLGNVVEKLTENGVYVDDNVRDLDGSYYRVAELWKFQKEMGEKKSRGEIDFEINIHVILGPGIENEDHRQDLVPKSVVFSKNENHKNELGLALSEGHRIVEISELVNDTTYLASLDLDGYVLSELERSSAILSANV